MKMQEGARSGRSFDAWIKERKEKDTSSLNTN